MIRAWSFRGQDAGVEVDASAISELLGKPDSLLWVDCTHPTADDIATLTDELALHPLTQDDLRNARQRTKLGRFDDHYHVALKDCALVGDDLALREVDIVFSEGWIVTVRHPDAGLDPEPAAEVLDRFTRQRGEHGENDEGFFIWAILDVIVDRYFAVTDAVDEKLDAIESIVFDEERGEIPREIFTLRRALITFRRAAGPLREVLNEFLRKEVPCIGDPALQHMQDVYDHVLRVLDLIESQRELLTGLLEGQLAVMSNRMNQVMKATSSWGAILIVATLVAGVYGMNFAHMPELSWKWGYLYALGVMGLLTLVLYRVFKRRGWL